MVFFKQSRVVTIRSNGFGGCTNLKAVWLGETSTRNYLYGRAFYSCNRLLSLYLLDTSTSCASVSTNTFTLTPISTYTTYTGGVRGSIYVRQSMLASYKAATVWSNYSSRFVGLTDEEIEQHRQQFEADKLAYYST